MGAEPSGPDLADEQDAAPAAGSQSPGRSRQPPSRRRPPVAKQARNATLTAAECALCVSPERLERSPVCRAERGAMPPPPLQPLFPPGPCGACRLCHCEGRISALGETVPRPVVLLQGVPTPTVLICGQEGPAQMGR